MSANRRPRLAYIVTVPTSARTLLRGQLRFMRESGFDVTVISSPGPELDHVAAREGVAVVGVPMEREISVARDTVSLARLRGVLGDLQPDIVNASTAKGGLLGMLAAASLRVPVRIYLLRGLRLETERGFKRTVLAATERLASACAHRVVCVSESLRQAYVAQALASPEKCDVLAAGSSNGVDATRFEPTEKLRARADELRTELGIESQNQVIGFVGRPVRDKGMAELLDAYDSIRPEHPHVRLLLVGSGLAGDSTDSELISRIRDRSDVMLADHVHDPAPYYAAMDILAFPTHREGFPNVPLEAACCQVPVVGFRATGVVDAVEDERTGLLCDIGDTRGLAEGFGRYLSDARLRAEHGRSARRRAIEQFAPGDVWRAWRSEYSRLLQTAGIPAPSHESRDHHSSLPRNSGI